MCVVGSAALAASLLLGLLRPAGLAGLRARCLGRGGEVLAAAVVAGCLDGGDLARGAEVDLGSAGAGDFSQALSRTTIANRDVMYFIICMVPLRKIGKPERPARLL